MSADDVSEERRLLARERSLREQMAGVQEALAKRGMQQLCRDPFNLPDGEWERRMTLIHTTMQAHKGAANPQVAGHVVSKAMGAQEERATIVAWLREQYERHAVTFAAAIEAGEHWKQ